MTENADTIRELTILSLSDAILLIDGVFTEFVAPDYSDEGIEEFRRHISFGALGGKLSYGELIAWGWYDSGMIGGVIAISPSRHINLLFVARRYQGRGVACALLDRALVYYGAQGTRSEITVNASPFAVPIYRKLGFAETGDERTVNGIRFIPMRREPCGPDQSV